MSSIARAKSNCLLFRFDYKATETKMKGSVHCLLVVLCCSSFALSVLGDDSDFIDEKGKALKNLKGKSDKDVCFLPRSLSLVISLK